MFCFMSEVFPMHRLKEHLKALPGDEEVVSLLNKVRAIGQIEHLTLTLGAIPVECAALVVGECVCVLLGSGLGLCSPHPRGKNETSETC